MIPIKIMELEEELSEMYEDLEAYEDDFENFLVDIDCCGYFDNEEKNRIQEAMKKNYEARCKIQNRIYDIDRKIIEG